METRTGEHRGALKARYYRAVQEIARRLAARDDSADLRGRSIDPQGANEAGSSTSSAGRSSTASSGSWRQEQ